MSEPIIYVDQSEVRDGKLEALKKGMNELAQFVEENEPRLFVYNVYFSDDCTRMTVLHVHPDATSLELHMQVAGRLFPKFSEFIRLVAIDVYGKPGDELMERLERKAEMLGSGAVRVHELHAGVVRFRDV